MTSGRVTFRAQDSFSIPSCEKGRNRAGTLFSPAFTRQRNQGFTGTRAAAALLPEGRQGSNDSSKGTLAILSQTEPKSQRSTPLTLDFLQVPATQPVQGSMYSIHFRLLPKWLEVFAWDRFVSQCRKLQTRLRFFFGVSRSNKARKLASQTHTPHAMKLRHQEFRPPTRATPRPPSENGDAGATDQPTNQPTNQPTHQPKGPACKQQTAKQNVDAKELCA